jgi:hypothetical protein
MDLFIKSAYDSFAIMPNYSISVYSEIDYKGYYVSMNNQGKNIEYFNLDSVNETFRVKSLRLYSYNSQNSLMPVKTSNNINPIQQYKKIQRLLIAGGRDINGISLSVDNGRTWYLPQNQPFTELAYGRCAFDGTRIVMGGNNNIAYSDDFGNNWIASGFTQLNIAYKIIYIESTKIWFAVGTNGRIGRADNVSTMARSTNGINWSIITQVVFDYGECYDIIFNGSVYIALGFGSQYCMHTSTDGISWSPNTSLVLDNPGNSNTQRGNCISYLGGKYILGCDFSFADINNPYSNILTSTDGINWDKTIKRYVPFHVMSIAYNGIDTYVIVGNIRGNVGGIIFYYWSNDLISFYEANNNLLSSTVSWVVWDGTNFIISGTGQATPSPSIIYSQDGKEWTVSENIPYSRISYGITNIILQ